MSAEAARQQAAARKPSRWRWRLLAIGLPLLLASFAANHLEYRYRQKRLKTAAETGALVVRTESSSSGHSQIGIDESSLKQEREGPMLRFSLLGEWDYDPQKPSACPAEVKELSGREASCVGFMYPLEAGGKLRLFCLLRTTQTCCYGPRPQYNQYLFVETKEPVKFERFAPVAVSGRFFVDPQPEQGYIYRMEGVSVSPAADDEPEMDPAQVALKKKAPLFDFVALSQVEKGAPQPQLPSTVLALDGKVVVVGGFVISRKDGPPQVVVGRDWWDGRGQGKPPTMFSALTIFLKAPQEMTPAWKQKDVFIGTLRVNHAPASWNREGIVSLHEAVRASGPGGAQWLAADSGPFLAVYHEALILAAFIFLCFRASMFGKPSATAAPEDRQGENG